MDSPAIRAVYLLAVAVVACLLPSLWMVAALAAGQLVLWPVVGLPIAHLGRQLRKLLPLSLLIGVAYAMMPPPSHGLPTPLLDPSIAPSLADSTAPTWFTLQLWQLELSFYRTGVLAGVAIILRIAAVVLASQLVRAGDPRALAAGLRWLGLPSTAATAVDAVLALLGDDATSGRRGQRNRRRRGDGSGRGRGDGSGRGRGDGSGRGRKDGAAASSWTMFWHSLGKLTRGDASVISDRVHACIARAEHHLHLRQTRSSTDEPHHGQTKATEDANTENTRDIAVVIGIALTMLGIKALKLLPGLPFAPGHKGVILIPLYIAAGILTRHRAGATLAGLTMGTVAFILGDGRWGIFEICKHVAPGILVDIGLPLFFRHRERLKQYGLWRWSLFGLIVALGRYGTVTVIALLAQPPALVYAALLPGLIVHGFFGALSGAVSAPLVRALIDRKTEPPESSNLRHQGDSS